MSKMLHLVNKSPFERNALQSCLRLAKDGSAVLLFEDGVYAAISKTAKAEMIEARVSGLKFYVLGPDLSARGLDHNSIIDGISVVDYGGFVDLVVDNDVTQSWL